MHRTFTLHIQEPGGQDGNLDAEVPSNFTPLGEITNAVVLRLGSKLPRLKVTRLASREEEKGQPL
jgi:hypothetical protein